MSTGRTSAPPSAIASPSRRLSGQVVIPILRASVRDALDAGELERLDGRDVQRVAERDPGRHVAVELLVEVLGLPEPAQLVAERDLLVHDHRGRHPALGERRQVDERLDRRSRLPLGERDVHLAVDVGVEVVHAADHRQDLAGLRVHHHDRGVLGVALGQGRRVRLRDLLHLELEVVVQRGVDLQAALVEHPRAVLLLDQGADVDGPVRRQERLLAAAGSVARPAGPRRPRPR